MEVIAIDTMMIVTAADAIMVATTMTSKSLSYAKYGEVRNHLPNMESDDLIELCFFVSSYEYSQAIISLWTAFAHRISFDC